MKSLKIYCFGNEFVNGDSLAKQIADELDIEGVKFVRCNSPDELEIAGDLLLMDVVKGIDKVMVIDDVDKLKDKNLCSLHDFDLSFFLKLLKELNQIKNIKIIGIPQQGDKEEIKKQISDLLPDKL